MNKILLCSLLVLGLTGCTTPPTIDTGSSFRVNWIGDYPVNQQDYLSLTFDLEDRAFGTGGCNHWFAGYGIEGVVMRFSKVGSTRRQCAPETMEQERRFFEFLGQVRTWDRAPNGELRLWPEQGKPMRLQAE